MRKYSDQDIIEKLNRWNFWRGTMKTGVLRGLYTDRLNRYIQANKVVTVVGVRRSGKSYILRQLAKNVIEGGGNSANTLIANFEEPAFERANLETLQDIYSAYKRIIRPAGRPYIFLDEIQNIDRWEKFARSLNELEEAFLVVTGSSSKLLSDELATVLAGRRITVEVFPLSFSEFLLFRGLQAGSLKDLLIEGDRVRILIDNYIKWGGFPEITLMDDEDLKLKTISGYYDDIVYKDVIQRFKIRRPEYVRDLAAFCLANISSKITFNSLSRFLKLPVETTRRLLSQLETSMAIFHLDKFSFRVMERLRSPRKVYTVDTGLCNVVGLKPFEPTGRMIENIVAVELLRKKASDPLLEVYYFEESGKYEVDFLIRRRMKVVSLIQVAYGIEKYGTRERELRALVSASDKLKCNDLLLITYNLEQEETFKGRKIRVVPLWKWLLGVK